MIAVRAAALSSAVLAFGSCASYEPRPLIPAEELAVLHAATLDNLRIDYVRPGAGAHPGEVPFDASDGLDEAELVGVALTLNPRLRAKRLEIGEARALLVSAGLWPDPDLGAFVRQGLGAGSSPELGLDLLVGLLRPDERPARRAVAEARIEATRAEIAAEELELAAAVRRARLRVLAAEQVARQLDLESRLRTEAVEQVRAQHALGETTQIAIALVELDWASVQRQLREARATFETERRALNHVAGLPSSYELPLAGLGQPLTFAVFADSSDADVEQRVLAGRFDLRAKAASYRQAEGELRLAVARQYPALGLGPSFEKEGGEDGTLGIAASAKVPLFDRNQGEIAARHAERARSRADYVASLHAALARAFDARAALRRAKEEVELQQRDVVPLIERAEALAEGALRARDLTVFEWITARSRTLQARHDLLDALVRYATAVAELEAATGLPLAAPVPDQTEIENQETDR